MIHAAATKTAETERPPLSFDDVFTLHHRAVYRVVYNLVRDAGIAEDVTQEVFLQYYRHQQTAPADDGLRPWLLRVGINAARNAVRGRSRSQAREDAFAQDESGAAANAPDVEYERQAKIAETRRALDKIKEPMRSCLLLQQQGLSYQEIATVLSVNNSYVGSLIARGRREFIRHYGKIGGGR
ncbi:MAG TPA: sigma-70 family RNA polymerase sigma factor [Pyrinomonadaceae bacterium]|nr:sigma-70 family RNA polymerase sigma factor [Pyrinomonadaceae bacterium]